MTEELLEIRKDLSEKLKKERFEHTTGVMYTAASLAMCYGEDIQKALTAGLLHDCGKYGSSEDQIRLCEKCGVRLTESELEMPALVHAKLGAYLARHKYRIKDQDILNAITYHTTGRPDMTLLEKIIYIADYIEPNRKVIPGLMEIRSIAFRDIDKAVYLSAENTVRYLDDGGKAVDPMTVSTCSYYRKQNPYYDERRDEMNQSKEMACIAYNALSDKKGEDIKIIDITGVSVLADYFIIANGNSDSQVNALVDNVEEELHKAGYHLRQREGRANSSWILLDFGDIIVHVFDKENRLFYDLERIWKDGRDITPEELAE